MDDARVFLANGCVIAGDPHEEILDNWFKEDHVGLCILYCLAIMSAMMTI